MLRPSRNPTPLTSILVMLLVLGCRASSPPVSLPADSPLSPTACGWDATTELAFAGWATPAQLGLDGVSQFSAGEQVFAIVSREPIDQVRLGGTGVIHGRAICSLGADGSIGVGSVADDWKPVAAAQPG